MYPSFKKHSLGTCSVSDAAVGAGLGAVTQVAKTQFLGNLHSSAQVERD